MFEGLQTRLGDVFDRLRKRGALSEADVVAAMRDIRVALLEADVALPVVRDFIAKVQERAVGAEVVRSVTPGQMVVKIVNDALVEMLGAESTEVNLAGTPPVAILMVGLLGSGKTTTAAKIGLRLKDKQKKKVLLASLDVQRPAAQEQLAILGQQSGVATLPIVAGQNAPQIARRAMDAARLGGYDAVILDTAGRLHIDDELMAEAAQVRDIARPLETLLVADAMTGQDAVNVAKSFNERIGITGIVLTRTDGDARGGAALSMRAVTGQPIKLIGVGEKLDALEPFHPARIASRILGMGDVVTLVEKAVADVEQADAERLNAKIQRGLFDLDDFAKQLRQIRKMGGMGGVLGLLPGIAKAKAQIAKANIDEKILVRQEAIILSMTPKERKNPDLIKASRKRRIATGAGVQVQEVNRLLKQFEQMQKMMKMMRSGNLQKMMRNLKGMLPGMR